MRQSRRLMLAAGFTLILGSEVVYTVLLSSPNGIRVKSPEAGVTLDRAFVVAGDAWMRGGIAGIQVEAASSGASPLIVAADRDVVRSRGTPLFPLSSWRATVTLPADGAWTIRAAASGTDGGAVTTPLRTVEVRAGRPHREFRSWTAEHLVPIAIIAAGSIALGLFARGSRKDRRLDETAAGGPRSRAERASALHASTVPRSGSRS